MGVSLKVLPSMDLQAQKGVKKTNIWIQHIFGPQFFFF